jgi:hypothetical protein
MGNDRKYAVMAIAGAAFAAAASGPASAQYAGNGYPGAYRYGSPYASYGAGDYGPNGACGCDRSYDYGDPHSSAGYGRREIERTIYVIELAPAPSKPRPIVHRNDRNEPKRLE